MGMMDDIVSGVQGLDARIMSKVDKTGPSFYRDFVRGPATSLYNLAEQFDSARHGHGFDPLAVNEAMLDFGMLAAPVGGMMTPVGSLGSAGGKRFKPQTLVPVPDELRKTLGLNEHPLYANYNKLLEKRGGKYASPEDVQNLVEEVMSDPNYTIPATDDRFLLFMKDRAPKDNGATVADFRGRGNKNWVRSAYEFNEGQMEGKLRKAEEKFPNKIVKHKE